MKDWLDTKGAASFLNRKVETIRYHIYVSKRLRPQRIGHSLVFSVAELNRFSDSLYQRTGRKIKCM